MANFEIALARTLKSEGGYSHDPTDRGGETAFGISRKAFPKWESWGYIEHILHGGYTPKYLDGEIKPSVDNLYLTNFWKPLRADEIADQDIANELFDFAVVAGVADSVKCLQRAVNSIFPKAQQLKDDGILGDKTMVMINWPYKVEKMFFAEFKLNRLCHHIDDVCKNPEQLKFLNGWKVRAINE